MGLGTLAMSMSACLLYTDPINAPPTVAIKVPDPIYRGQAALFSATVADPDADKVTLEWTMAEGPCPIPFDATQRPTGTPVLGPLFSVSPPRVPLFCVWVRATDVHGAFAVADAEAAVMNHAPTAGIQVQQPAGNAAGEYDLYSDFRLSAAASTDADGDVLTYTWNLKPGGFPPASTAQLSDCSPLPPANQVQCFTADRPGRYTVELRVDDGSGASSPPASVDLMVSPDAPPCITDTSPPWTSDLVVLDPFADRSFEVDRVRDDGDPYPAGAHGVARFAWSIDDGAGAWRPVAGYDLPTLLLAGGSFGVGDEVRLRVQALDRESSSPARSLASCGDADLCAPTSGCTQWVTWHLEFR